MPGNGPGNKNTAKDELRPGLFPELSGRQTLDNARRGVVWHRVAVISDTHDLLRDEVREILGSCEAILHAGDIGQEGILRELRETGTVYAVRGNTDRGPAADLPGELEFVLFGRKIYMTHDRKQIRKNREGTDLVVFGHSHKYEERREGETLFLNPGSCGPKRFRLPVTMAVLEIAESARGQEAGRERFGKPEEDGLRIKRIDLSGEKDSGSLGRKTGRREKAVSAGNLRALIESVVREMEAGRSIEKIAAGCGISRELAEQICRIHVTHPGVGAEGILNRMEVSALQVTVHTPLSGIVKSNEIYFFILWITCRKKGDNAGRAPSCSSLFSGYPHTCLSSRQNTACFPPPCGYPAGHLSFLSTA